MGPSKILTVSYGTFSCTLEGFDDPFATMRGIAEYFRDLAAQDRYFGAEPPTPDAEMLHRIAEREVQRRVEARVEEDGVVLRQVDGESPEPAPQPSPSDTVKAAPAIVAASVAAAAATSLNDQAPEAAQETVDETPHEEPVEADHVETVAEKLARIRSAVPEEAAYLEDQHADDAFTAAPISSVFDAVEEPDMATEAESETEPELQDEADEAQAEAEQPEAETAEAADEEQESGPDYEPSEPVEEAFFEDGGTPSDESDLNDVLPEAEEEHFASAASDEEEPPAEDDAEPEEQEQYVLGASHGEEMIEDAIEEEEGESWDDAQVAAPDAPAIARVVKMRREDFENAIQASDLEEYDESEEEPILGEETVAELVEESEAEEETVSAEAQEELASSLSEQDEAELMATLEEVQRKAEADARAEKEGRQMLENQDIEQSTETVSHILEVTDSEMEEKEGSRRRSAIAHLKAAVAATRADKLLSRKRAKDEADEMDRYREDLAEVVRPRRPVEGGNTRKSRRAAPLVLVSEQRVNDAADETQEEAPRPSMVQPRRINRGSLAEADDFDQDGDMPDNIFVEPESFAKFAADMGAHDLPDLLEAAAAYTSYVEGREYFSRPQIMKAVAGMKEDGEYTREETLRSFGLLLRRGKIRKIKRGQFTIAESTRFKPQQLAAGE